jgi:hypothetical protein
MQGAQDQLLDKAARSAAFLDSVHRFGYGRRAIGVEISAPLVF